MDALTQVTSELDLNAEERAATEAMLRRAEELAGEAGFPLDEQALLGLAAHMASMLRRIAEGERVAGVDTSLFDQVPEAYRLMAARLVIPLYERVEQPLDQTETGLLALHFAAAHERAG